MFGKRGTGGSTTIASHGLIYLFIYKTETRKIKCLSVSSAQ